MTSKLLIAADMAEELGSEWCEHLRVAADCVTQAGMAGLVLDSSRTRLSVRYYLDGKSHRRMFAGKPMPKEVEAVAALCIGHRDIDANDD